jgi:hypothetical protein
MILAVRRPRVVSVRRAQAEGWAPGDSVVVRLDPGLLAFLQMRDAAGCRLGDGMAPEWWLGLGAAATAATVAGGEERGWTGVTFSVRWARAAQEGEILLARSTVERAPSRRFGKIALVHGYEVTSERTGERLATGTLVLATADVQRATDPVSIPAPPAAAVPPLAPGWSERLRSAARSILPPVLAAPMARAYRRARAADVATVPPLRWITVPDRLEIGQTAAIEIEITNNGTLSGEMEATLALPFGFGLDAAWTDPSRVRVGAGQSVRVRGTVTALRADEVNLGRPWTLTCALNADGRDVGRLPASIAVPDPAPARIFYVITEDCETFDGGETTGRYGAARALGNANGFMDPEEYRYQMIEKPAAMNRIAERHGARITHFWTTTQLSAARWAARHSSTGAWDAIVSDLEASVRDGARRHEYAPHIHFDFEPDSALPPQPRLRYDAATDGLLPEEYYDPAANPDHKFHGWDGARKGIAYVKEEGDLARPDSKAGSLRAATRTLARLAHAAGAAPSLVTRTGACDFGATAADLDASFRALEANGLLANADAGLYAHVGEHPRRRQMYFCRRSDLEQEIGALTEAGPVELRAPEAQIEGAALAALNAWFDTRAAESKGAGVRAIVTMTHAMFMKGEPDPFRSTAGGDFDKLDLHLAHVRRNHPGVAFATASEAVLEFLDYYTPALRAVVTRPRFGSADGRSFVYPIRLLGRGIPVSAARPMRVTVMAPAAFDPADVAALAVRLDGAIVATGTRATATQLPRVEFLATECSGYELEVTLGAALEGAPDAERDDDILRLDDATLVRAVVAQEGTLTTGDVHEWALPAEPFTLLAQPMAGRPEPLGRRVHPYGFYPLGAALHAALGLAPGAFPLDADIRWRQTIRGGVGFRLRCAIVEASAARVVLDCRFDEAGVPCAEMRITLARPSSSGA